MAIQNEDAEYRETLRRKDVIYDGIEAAQRAAARLTETTMASDLDGAYAKGQLCNARKHAERLLAVIVELGG